MQEGEICHTEFVTCDEAIHCVTKYRPKRYASIKNEQRKTAELCLISYYILQILSVFRKIHVGCVYPTFDNFTKQAS